MSLKTHWPMLILAAGWLVALLLLLNERRKHAARKQPVLELDSTALIQAMVRSRQGKPKAWPLWKDVAEGIGYRHDSNQTTIKLDILVEITKCPTEDYPFFSVGNQAVIQYQDEDGDYWADFNRPGQHVFKGGIWCLQSSQGTKFRVVSE